MADRYTKIVLTIIAGALCALVLQNATSTAVAVGDGCGASSYDPCHVYVEGGSIEVDGRVQVWGSVHAY